MPPDIRSRLLRWQRSVLAEVTALDRLAYLGTRTMEALTYHPPDDPSSSGQQLLDLHEMAQASVRSATAELEQSAFAGWLDRL